MPLIFTSIMYFNLLTDVEQFKQLTLHPCSAKYLNVCLLHFKNSYPCNNINCKTGSSLK